MIPLDELLRLSPGATPSCAGLALGTTRRSPASAPAALDPELPSWTVARKFSHCFSSDRSSSLGGAGGVASLRRFGGVGGCLDPPSGRFCCCGASWLAGCATRWPGGQGRKCCTWGRRHRAGPTGSLPLCKFVPFPSSFPTPLPCTGSDALLTSLPLLSPLPLGSLPLPMPQPDAWSLHGAVAKSVRGRGRGA